MKPTKPHIYFNPVKRLWCVRRNSAGTDAFIHAMGWAYKLNTRRFWA